MTGDAAVRGFSGVGGTAVAWNGPIRDTGSREEPRLGPSERPSASMTCHRSFKKRRSLSNRPPPRSQSGARLSGNYGACTFSLTLADPTWLACPRQLFERCKIVGQQRYVARLHFSFIKAGSRFEKLIPRENAGKHQVVGL